ncbi:MAG: DUF3127 domain-containing protein [Prevotellaceae bacterium]|jgi:hypothetical protein|nr:DUF3127 domain-containing protein [Prevotellaceae bacterium]
MVLDVTGKLVQVLEMQTGTSSRGDWKRQDFILETEEQYPRKICVSLWGDRASDIVGIAMGDSITASINLESREFNGRWYTDVRAWRVVRAVPQAQAGGAPTAQGASVPPTAVPPPPIDDDFTASGETFDDLPF